MKFTLLWLFSVCILMGQSEDPFKAKTPLNQESDESVYDFDDVHKWDDVIVKGIDKAEQSIITWGGTHVASHKGVDGKCHVLQFSVDAKAYEEALGHPDSNRGVILMAGDARFPLLHCWLRPFSVYEGKALFTVNIPVERLGEMYIAFIPREGKKRFLYCLKDVVLDLKSRKTTQEK